jgi:hypothetical protein
MNPSVANKLSSLPETLAQIDEFKVRREDFAQVISDNVPPQELPGFLGAPDEAIKAEAKQFAESEIDRILMTKMAAEAGFPCNKEAMEKDFDLWVSQLSPTQKSDFEKKISEQEGRSLDEYRSNLCGDLRQQGRLAVSTWLNTKVYSTFKISEAEVQSAYDQADKSQMISAPQVKVMHIPFRHDGSAEKRQLAEEKAKAVWNKIKQGADFLDMVKENPSSEGHLKRMGILDFFPAGTFNEIFEKAAFALKPNEMSPLVETPDGFEIIKCLEIKAGTVKSLGEMSGQIREQLHRKMANTAIEQLLTNARSSHKVTLMI